MSEGGKKAIRADDEMVAKAEVLTLQRQIRQLQRVLGKKTLENEILRKAVKLAHRKTDLAVAVVVGRAFAVKRVADVLGVSRSQLTERLEGAAEGRSQYAKADDAGRLTGMDLEKHLAQVGENYPIKITEKKRAMDDFYQALKSAGAIDTET